jgi:hypothetical protein
MTNRPTTSASAAAKPGKSGASAGGIAAGVIVAVLVVAAIFGGVLFYFRRKRQQENEVEEIHAKKDMSFASATTRAPAAAANAASGDRPGMWAPDSRMDSGTAQQRVSTGSIADNQDFSRRILQVCPLLDSGTVADSLGAKPRRVLNQTATSSPSSLPSLHPHQLHHPPTRQARRSKSSG